MDHRRLRFGIAAGFFAVVAAATLATIAAGSPFERLDWRSFDSVYYPTVPQPSPTPEPSPTPQPSPTPEEFCGDVTHDGRVNFVDLLLVAIHALQGDNNPNYDVNRDQEVNIDDALIVLDQLGNRC
ncbi:MAG TPA: dockerin type I domain-containing protein [Dehalococcoidia bacterium]|nr:dockerin type I domain-containing protein [Dehalococcoidia bacterium]